MHVKGLLVLISTRLSVFWKMAFVLHMWRRRLLACVSGQDSPGTAGHEPPLATRVPKPRQA